MVRENLLSHATWRLPVVDPYFSRSQDHCLYDASQAGVQCLASGDSDDNFAERAAFGEPGNGFTRPLKGEPFRDKGLDLFVKIQLDEIVDTFVVASGIAAY